VVNVTENLLGGEYGSTLGGVSFTAKGTSIFYTSIIIPLYNFVCLYAIVLYLFSLRPLQELFEDPSMAQTSAFLVENFFIILIIN
jgi:hypothetical protein